VRGDCRLSSSFPVLSCHCRHLHDHYTCAVEGGQTIGSMVGLVR